MAEVQLRAVLNAADSVNIDGFDIEQFDMQPDKMVLSQDHADSETWVFEDQVVQLDEGQCFAVTAAGYEVALIVLVLVPVTAEMLGL